MGILTHKEYLRKWKFIQIFVIATASRLSQFSYETIENKQIANKNLNSETFIPVNYSFVKQKWCPTTLKLLSLRQPCSFDSIGRFIVFYEFEDLIVYEQAAVFFDIPIFWVKAP